MTLDEMMDRVKNIFGDTTGVEITDTELTEWANDGQLDIVRQSGALQASVSFSAVVDTEWYSLGDNVVDVRRVTHDGNLLRRTTLEELDKYHANREVDFPSGTPQYWYIWAGRLYFYPAPSVAGTDNIDVLYTKSPALLVNPGDIPELPVKFHLDIVRYMLARAKEKDEQFAEASKIMSDLTTRVALTQSQTDNPFTDSYPSVRCLPWDEGEYYW